MFHKDGDHDRYKKCTYVLKRYTCGSDGGTSIFWVKSLPKVLIDDEMDLIDEDCLLSEEDLKKPQFPLVGDCKVGSTRKACKNCNCGCAEDEEKVKNLGITMDQLENPQSACGSVSEGL
ncbi:anamorsin [Tanacetum coccineum]